MGIKQIVDICLKNAITIPTLSKIRTISSMFHVRKEHFRGESRKHNGRSITTTTALKTLALSSTVPSVSGFALTLLKVNPDYLSGTLGCSVSNNQGSCEKEINGGLASLALLFNDGKRILVGSLRMDAFQSHDIVPGQTHGSFVRHVRISMNIFLGYAIYRHHRHELDTQVLHHAIRKEQFRKI